MRASTVHTALAHCRINCLSHIEQVSGEPMRRYECDHSGSLIHVGVIGVTKFVNTPMAAAGATSADDRARA